jgi:hypothetical protein
MITRLQSKIKDPIIIDHIITSNYSKQVTVIIENGTISPNMYLDLMLLFAKYIKLFEGGVLINVIISMTNAGINLYIIEKYLEKEIDANQIDIRGKV